MKRKKKLRIKQQINYWSVKLLSKWYVTKQNKNKRKYTAFERCENNEIGLNLKCKKELEFKKGKKSSMYTRLSKNNKWIDKALKVHNLWLVIFILVILLFANLSFSSIFIFLLIVLYFAIYTHHLFHLYHNVFIKHQVIHADPSICVKKILYEKKQWVITYFKSFIPSYS